MSIVRCQIAISLDGFIAGPNQSLKDPIGEGGMRLHEWMFETAFWKEQQGEKGGARNADSDVLDEVFQNVGAYIMGRNMFGAEGDLGTGAGEDGGARIRRITRPCSSSRITRGIRCAMFWLRRRSIGKP